MHDLPPQGPIDDAFLPRLVAGLHQREFEGVLRLTLNDAVKILYFKKGEIASAASNAEPDRLANILIREGRLTGEQLDLARSRLPAGGSLGKALIEMGFLTPSELLQGARQQVRVIVASSFAATSGTYEISPGPLPAEVTSLGLNTRRLLFDSLMEAGDRAAIIREVGSMEAVYRPTGRLDFTLTSLKLDAETDRIGRLLNGTDSLRDISSRTSHDDFTVSKVVLALDLLGAAETVAPEEEAAPAVGSGRAIPIVSEAQGGAQSPVSLEIIPAGATEIVEENAVARTPSAVMAVVADMSPRPDPPSAIVMTEPIDTTPSLEAPADPAADEPPPIPQDELPAFARSPEESSGEPQLPPAPESGPQWQIDPETGERVHVGPIEITFDGRIAPGHGESRSLMWVLLTAGAVTLVVAGALGYVILRRGADSSAGAVPHLAPAPVATEPVQVTGTVVEPTSAGPAVVAPEDTASGPAAPTGVPAVPARSPAGQANEPVSPPAATPLRAPENSSAGAAAGLTADPRYGAALLRLDQGDPAGAARLFEEWIIPENRSRFSLQFMIACQEETVKGARSRSGEGGALFILPYSLKGRSCYRVCWGIYDDGASARAAMPGVPSALVGETAPIVVPLSRLRSSG